MQDRLAIEEMTFRPGLRPEDVEDLASRYVYPLEDGIEKYLGPAAKARGYLRKHELVRLCYWKTPRTRARVARNLASFVEETTRLALSSRNEQVRIQVLTLLHGVSWPTASVILHFCHQEPYPIIDFRALWSLGVDHPPAFYSFDYWWRYVLCCRRLAEELGVSMRTLDRALWQYSKENQTSM